MFNSLKSRLAMLLACVACVCAFAGASAGAASASCWPCADNQAQAIWYDGYNPPAAQGLVSSGDNGFPVGSILNLSYTNGSGYSYYYMHLHFQEQHIGLFSTSYTYWSCPLTVVSRNTDGAWVAAWYDGCTRYA